MAKAKRKLDEGEVETNLIPIMNVMFLLIPALLLAMEVARFASIHVSPPLVHDHVSGPTTKDPESLKLSVVIAGDGYRVVASHQQLGTDAGRSLDSTKPTIPLARPSADVTDFERYDYAQLEAEAQRLKQLFPHETVVKVTADGDIPFQVLTRTIDALRGGDCRLSQAMTNNEEVPAECLFFHPIVEA
jgi:biopolymer transport protein ExbD